MVKALEITLEELEMFSLRGGDEGLMARYLFSPFIMLKKTLTSCV